MTIPYHPEATAPACAMGNDAERPPVLSENLFRGVLTRERRRSDRSGQPFLLLELALSPRQESRAASLSLWQAAGGAATAAAGPMAVSGWIKREVLLGIIVPTGCTWDSGGRLDDLKRRLLSELGGRLEAALVSRLSVHLQVCPAPERTIERYTESWDSTAPTQAYDVIKRGLDVIGSLVILVLLTPVLTVIAVLVKLSSRGPILYRQERIGYCGKPFTMLKFRTMHSNTDPKIHQEFVSAFIKGSGAVSRGGTDGFFKLTNDPRITPIGRLLRSTSLDELPQLWNVLRGEMSMVGPRPPLPYEFEQYAPWHRRRILEAKPGITGLWQVVGRSRTTFDEMVRLDLSYVKTRTIWNDLKILLATPVAVISGKGAC